MGGTESKRKRRNVVIAWKAVKTRIMSFATILSKEKPQIRQLFVRRKCWSIKLDPIEQTKEFQKIKEELERRVVEIVGEYDGLGYCHRYWAVKKTILESEYNIDWKTPQEMNPNDYFD